MMSNSAFRKIVIELSRTFAATALFFASLGLTTPTLAKNPFIIVQSTTSTQNSGLYDFLLPLFTKSTGIDVRVVAVGTGQALRNAEKCDGDVLIVEANAETRKGDRVVVRTREGEVLAKVLVRRTTRQIELMSINPAHANIVFDLSDIEWIARILWASQ